LGEEEIRRGRFSGLAAAERWPSLDGGGFGGLEAVSGVVENQMTRTTLVSVGAVVAPGYRWPIDREQRPQKPPGAQGGAHQQGSMCCGQRRVPAFRGELGEYGVQL